MEKLRFMRGAAALLAGSAMLFASCSDDDAPMPDPELTLTPDTEISLPVGGSVEVAVSTNLGSWTALSNETWCEVTLAEGKFTVSADANDALAARPTATATVTAGEGERSITREVRVTQGAQTFTDLSAAGRANCYIVAPKSASVFDAAYKGNSSTESIGAAEGAELVWQSAQGLVTRVAYAADEKKIIVETADKSGNAVVAAVDESGTILWSWHLWIVDYDPSASLFTTAPNASGTTWSFMDRNLGALTVERGSFDSHGLLYQWGRKDPFPGTTAFTIMNEDYTYEVDGEPEVYGIDNRVLPKFGLTAEFHGTIEKSIRNPAVFYAMTYKHTGVEDEYGEEIVENDYKTGDWVDVSDDDYWGGESRKKTIYVPALWAIRFRSATPTAIRPTHGSSTPQGSGTKPIAVSSRRDSGSPRPVRAPTLPEGWIIPRPILTAACGSERRARLRTIWNSIPIFTVSICSSSIASECSKSAKTSVRRACRCAA